MVKELLIIALDSHDTLFYAYWNLVCIRGSRRSWDCSNIKKNLTEKLIIAWFLQRRRWKFERMKINVHYLFEEKKINAWFANELKIKFPG